MQAQSQLTSLVHNDCAHWRADMQQMSAALKAQSKEYSKSAQKLYRSAVFQKYLPVLVLVGVVLLILLFRWLYKR